MALGYRRIPQACWRVTPAFPELLKASAAMEVGQAYRPILIGAAVLAHVRRAVRHAWQSSQEFCEHYANQRRL